MVRLKNRYLLVNILYPDAPGSTAAVKIPDVVAFNQPTSDALTAQVLLRAIRAQVADLFGDYGSGVIADSLSGLRIGFLRCENWRLTGSSQVFVTRNLDLHHKSFSRALQDSMGSTIIHGHSTYQEWPALRLQGCASQWDDQESRGGGHQTGA